jgi:hypothetical protein
MRSSQARDRLHFQASQHLSANLRPDQSHDLFFARLALFALDHLAKAVLAAAVPHELENFRRDPIGEGVHLDPPLDDRAFEHQRVGSSPGETRTRFNGMAPLGRWLLHATSSAHGVVAVFEIRRPESPDRDQPSSLVLPSMALNFLHLERWWSRYDHRQKRGRSGPL